MPVDRDEWNYYELIRNGWILEGPQPLAYSVDWTRRWKTTCYTSRAGFEPSVPRPNASPVASTLRLWTKFRSKMLAFEVGFSQTLIFSNGGFLTEANEMEIDGRPGCCMCPWRGCQEGRFGVMVPRAAVYSKKDSSFFCFIFLLWKYHENVSVILCQCLLVICLRSLSIIYSLHEIFRVFYVLYRVTLSVTCSGMVWF